jgi:hypothetical protein
VLFSFIGLEQVIVEVTITLKSQVEEADNRTFEHMQTVVDPAVPESQCSTHWDEFVECCFAGSCKQKRKLEHQGLMLLTLLIIAVQRLQMILLGGDV